MRDIDDIVLNFSPASLTLLNAILCLVMFAIALDLRVDDFRAISRNPKAFDPAHSMVSTLPDGGFGIWRGTSFSCALVSGAAALVRAQHPEGPSTAVPVGSIAETIVGTLSDTAVPIDAQNPEFEGLLGNGRLDVLAATLAGPPQAPEGDLDGDGLIGAADLSMLLSAWGACGTSCPADLDRDGSVGPADLVLLLGAWG